MTLRTKLIRLAHENPALRPHLLPLLKTAAMSEADFWKLIEPYGWGRKTIDYKPIKKSLLGKVPQDEAQALSDAFGKLKGSLAKAVSKWERENDKQLPVSDDGFDDLLSHIIGMGKREYEAALKDPAKVFERANKGDYKESFAYALPYKTDYASLSISKYLSWAKKIIGEYNQVLNASEDDVPWKSKLNAPLKQVISVMEEFVRDESIPTLLAQEEAVKKATGEIEKILSRLGYGSSLPEEDTLEAALKHVANKWFVWNLFTDVRDYMA